VAHPAHDESVAANITVLRLRFLRWLAEFKVES
jgi:hypothetical protein